MDEEYESGPEDSASDPTTPIGSNSTSSTPDDGNGVTGSLWDSDAALDSLKLEREFSPNESDEERTKRILVQAGPQAAMSIVQLAMHATNENTRLNAAKYVTDVARDIVSDTIGASWETILAGAIKQVEEHANEGSGN